MADHAAKVVLDRSSDRKSLKDEAFADALAKRANFRRCVDGALRGNSEASGGMALLAYFPDGSKVVVYRAGTVFGKLASAFLAEVLTLEWGLKEFAIPLKNKRHT